jgi:hypothetical protein
MGVIQKFNGKRPFPDAASASPPTGQDARHDGRERLRFAAAELAKACDCVTDLEARLTRLTTIISDADAAHVALQEAIAADGGVALEAYGAGRASDQPIAKLVGAKENTAKAASAAKDALPNVQGMLAKARAECSRLESVKFDAVIVYLKTRASDEHKSYMRAFRELSDSYDRLCGIAVAVSATGHSDIMTTGLPVPIRAPGFNMGTGPSHGSSELVTMMHTAGEAKVANWTAKWMQARERLDKDAEADLDDLISPQLQYESDRDL